MVDLNFFKNKRIFLTGHTGFKGAWLSRILVRAGAELTGYALDPPTIPSLWQLMSMDKDMRSVIGDIRDFDTLKKSFAESKPEIVFHMAAQPIVREGYRDPLGTYATNVMGTAHLLECIRFSDNVQSVLNVTTDKVYRNLEWFWGYRENDILDGYDPYSNSKSCSELVTETYKRSFFTMKNSVPSVSTARSGNVIGGGDFAKDRIIPDCVRAVERAEAIAIRNPYSIRPYQHVLEALSAYMLIAQSQYIQPQYSGCYNVGPNDGDCITTGDLAALFCEAWGEPARWENHSEINAPHEAGFLKLDCSLIKSKLGWFPRRDIREAVSMTVLWEKVRLTGQNVLCATDKQIDMYFTP